MDDGQLKFGPLEIARGAEAEERDRRGHQARHEGLVIGQESLLIGIIQALVERATPAERRAAIKRLEASIAGTAHRKLVEEATPGWQDAERARAAAEEIHCVLVDALGDAHTEWYPAEWFGDARAEETAG
jgi:hypothetical protein